MIDKTEMPHNTRFLVDKSNLNKQFFDHSEPPAALIDGQIRLAVDRFALTANNITYAAFGDIIGYWQFFPCADDNVGQVPVWGFADVVESRHSDISTGERVYGFLPLARQCVATPVRVTDKGFADASEHRMELPSIYNQYVLVGSDPAYMQALEAQQMILRPLFMTSYLIEDFFAQKAYFGAARIILSSASSKTAIGLAHQVTHREGRPDEIVGLTSMRNRSFVAGLDYYDHVFAYENIEELPQDRPTVFVDIAGNGDIIRRVHGHIGGQLKYSCLVGASHWDAEKAPTDSLEPKPEWFFAPTHFQNRAAKIGTAGVLQDFANSWSGFIESTNDWMQIVELKGEVSIQQTFSQLLTGSAPPSNGFILSF